MNRIQPNNAPGITFVGAGKVTFGTASLHVTKIEALEGRFDTKVFGQTVAYHTLRHDSDQTLKENILPIEHGILNKLLGVGVYTFTSTEEAQQKYGYGRETHIGFLAQQTQQHLPMLVGVHSVGGDTDVYHIESHYWPPGLVRALKEVHEEFSGKFNMLAMQQPRIGRVCMANGLACVDIRESWGDVYADRVAETTKYKCVVTTQNEGGWDATRGVVNGGVLRIVCQNRRPTTWYRTYLCVRTSSSFYRYEASVTNVIQAHVIS